MLSFIYLTLNMYNIVLMDLNFFYTKLGMSRLDVLRILADMDGYNAVFAIFIFYRFMSYNCTFNITQIDCIQ